MNRTLSVIHSLLQSSVTRPVGTDRMLVTGGRGGARSGVPAAEPIPWCIGERCGECCGWGRAGEAGGPGTPKSPGGSGLAPLGPAHRPGRPGRTAGRKARARQKGRHAEWYYCINLLIYQFINTFVYYIIIAI